MTAYMAASRKAMPAAMVVPEITMPYLGHSSLNVAINFVAYQGNFLLSTFSYPVTMPDSW
jgi:hypothetical protein